MEKVKKHEITLNILYFYLAVPVWEVLLFLGLHAQPRHTSRWNNLSIIRQVPSAIYQSHNTTTLDYD